MNKLIARKPGSLLLAVIVYLLTASNASGQRLVNWTEEPGELGLGYPVPIPQDSPLPFDGFRSYSALNARHLDLTNTRDDITRYVIGNTIDGREISLYVMSDNNPTTVDGRVEGSVLINGGIHAREWQSPEVVTGVMELLADQGDDQYFYQYLMENMNIAIVPVLNIDGFLQTQRFPEQNYLDSFGTPSTSPRDGRMRRKNMRDVDEVLGTVGDHLNGIDLNRNNPPFWAMRADPPPGSGGASSSADPQSIVYHGTGPFSEPETESLSNAPNQNLPGSDQITLGERLRYYIDVHSFTRVFLPTPSFNTALLANQQAAAQAMVRHHASIPDGRSYAIGQIFSPNTGVGFTPEYFGTTFDIPSWTLEIEPTSAGGSEYGGLRSSFADGFILPESEIRRVRENMAATLAAGAFYQAGPPAIQRIRVVDANTGSILFESGQQPMQMLQLGVDYLAEIGFNKPMRWLDENNDIVPFPGQFAASLNFTLRLETPGGNLNVPTGALQWPLEAGFFGGGFQNYMTDTVIVPFSISDNQANNQLINGTVTANIAVTTGDMVGFGLDANPATPIDWQNGDWINYEIENAQGTLGTTDRSVSLMVSDNVQTNGYQIDNSISGTWQSLGQDGIGYIIELLPDGRVAVSWATFDEQGNQRWLIGIGEILGNRIVVDNLSFSTGPSFGPDFDPADAIRQTQAGSLEFVFTDCNEGSVEFRAFGQSGRLDDFVPTTQIAGIGCQIDNVQLPPLAFVSGTWFDPSHNGEGFTIHVLPDGRVIMYWYTFDSEGNQFWLIGVGTVGADNRIVFNNVRTSSGGRFGNDFDPDDVAPSPWGTVVFELGCDSGTVTYDSSDPEFGSGTLNLVKLTNIAGIACPQ